MLEIDSKDKERRAYRNKRFVSSSDEGCRVMMTTDEERVQRMAERRSTYADRHGENFVCKRIALIYSTRSLILNQWRDLRIAEIAEM